MATDSSYSLKLQIVHGQHKFEVNLAVPESEAGDNLCLKHLTSEICKVTKIPPEAQKLIFKGKSFKDPNEDLHQCGLKNGSKVMLIGKRAVPEDDPNVKQLKAVESTIEKQDKKLSEVTYDLDGIHRGFLHENLQYDALRKQETSIRSISETLTKCLEKLDSLQFDESNKEARAKRKSLVDRILSLLSRSDSLMQGVSDMIARWSLAQKEKNS